jgi:hypothetical protein
MSVVERQQPRQFRPGLEMSTWPNLKHARAIALFREFQGRIEIWSAGQPFTTDKILSDDGLCASVVLRVHQQPLLDEWALLFGDAVHNLRSALDSLVWELAHFDGREPRNPKGLYFPIITDEVNWPRAARMLESCPAEVIERIRLMQPFLIQDAGPSGLEVLGDLSNQDKHRTPIRSSISVHQFMIDNASFEFEEEDDIPDPPFRVKVDDTVPMEDGSVVVAFESTARMVKMRAPLVLTPRFAVDYKGQPAEVEQTINAMAQYARIIMDAVTRGHPTEHPPEDEEGWAPLEA